MKARVRRFAAAFSIVRQAEAASVTARAIVALTTVLLAPSWAAAQTPYNGSPASIPGGIQAEHYDRGGQGVAYYDDSRGNSGGAFRWEDVDIEPTNNPGGYAISWARAGEWARFTVNVTRAGSYYVNTRVSSQGSGGTFYLMFKGQKKSGSLRIPNTGGWRTYQDLGTTVSLDAGIQEMRVVFESNGSTGFVGNLSYLEFKSAGTTTSTPSTGSGTASAFGGTAWTLPGGIQAEDFDNGGNKVGYYDKTAGNAGGAYRQTDVDIANTSGGGYAVGWISAGEWLRYTVNVTKAGAYTVKVRVASAGSGGTFHISFNGQDKSGTLRVPNTGGWNTYQDLSANVTLDAGVHVMRLVFDSNGSTGAVGNVSYMQFDAGSTAPATSGGGGGGTGGGRLRVMTWNIHFGHSDTWSQARTIANSGAHVVLLQEASTWNEYMPTSYPDKLRQLTGQTWYSVWAPHGGRYTNNEGTLILSRLPIVAKSTMNSTERGFARAVVNVGGVNVTLFSVHLDWNTSMRTSQLDAFMSWERQFGGPKVAGGDWNSWWGESWIAKTLQAYTDTWVDVKGTNEGGYTLNGAVRFDYLFRGHSNNWRITPTSIWTQSGASDHAAVIADYDIR